jgi:hypothetical protein
MEMSRRGHLKDKHPTKTMTQAYYDAKKKFREDYRKKYRATMALKDGRRKYREKSVKSMNDRFGKNGHVIDYLPVIFPESDVGNGCIYRRPKAKMRRICRHEMGRVAVTKRKCEPHDWNAGGPMRPKMQVWGEWVKGAQGERTLQEFLNVTKDEEEFRNAGGKTLKLGPEAEKRKMAAEDVRWPPLKAVKDDKNGRLGRPPLKAGKDDKDERRGGRRSKGGASSSSSARTSA